ncbi:MAG: hypothetical protein RMI45_08045 [Ignisphaera sp.]|nr:hypothetical protein [Ignisphaera sp.]MDW8086167.1 hypothetical protein [Ignisphaera sp.]
MGIVRGILAVAAVSIALVSLVIVLLLLGQETPSVLLWIAMTLGGSTLLVMGVHMLSASILTYLRVRRKGSTTSASE